MNESNQQLQQPQQPYYDEISLVDLATTLIRRRRILYGVLVAVIGFALLYAFVVVGEVKEYTTLIQLAEEQTEEGRQPVEPATTVLATIESRWLPELQASYAETEGEKLPFKVNVSNPKETPLIKLASEAPSEKAGEVEKVHQQLVNDIVERQNSLINRSQRALQQRLSSVESTLQQLNEKQVAGEAIAQTIQERVDIEQERVDIEAELESLRTAEVLVVARESLENAGPGKLLILALATVLGLMLGIFAAFMVEFGSRVRQAMKDKE